MIKISVVVPVYNCEEYLEQCIKSIFLQTLKELEVICVDDGSTDASAQILRSLAAKNARIVLFRQENQGAGSARNLGIEKAKGKYICFLDADDYYKDRDALEIMFRLCEAQDVSACACYQMYMKNGDNENAVEVFPKKVKNTVVLYKDYQVDYFYQSFLFRREFLIENHISFPHYLRYQDPPFLVKALYAADKLAVADTCLYCYRRSDLSTRFNTQKTADLLRGLIDNLIFAEQHSLNILFRNTADCLENELGYIIYNNISPDDLEILKLLMQANQIISAGYGIRDYMIKPLRLIMFPLHRYEDDLLQRIEAQNEIALYGAGKYAKMFLDYLRRRKLLEKVTSIVVSDLQGNKRELKQIPVITLQRFLQEKKCHLLVTAGKKNKDEIVDFLHKNNYLNYEVIEEIFWNMLFRMGLGESIK